MGGPQANDTINGQYGYVDVIQLHQGERVQGRSIQMHPSSVSRPVPMIPPGFSLVVPLRNEEGAIDALVEGIAAVLGSRSYELLLVDDGSTDRTREKCLSLASRDPRIRVLGHPASAGQSAALHSGVLAARAPIIATLDGDGQNPPENLPRLIAPLTGPDADPACGLVAGQRVGRKDTLSKRLASRFANALRSAVLRDGTRDTGCGLKAFRRDAFLALPYFNHMHRYLPALFARDGWAVRLVDVTHAPRKTGRSNYGNLDRALVGIVDLVGVAWLIRRRKRAKAALLTAQPAIERVFPKAEPALSQEGTVDA
jgi:dolichol-phosphate mannosyltransferase